jgi:hypothetical protein
VAFEDLCSILDNALGIAYVALLCCNSGIRKCLEIDGLFVGLLKLFAYEVAGAIGVALEKLHPVFKSVLSEGQIAILGLDGGLYNCLVCITKGLGEIPGRFVCLVFLPW